MSGYKNIFKSNYPVMISLSVLIVLPMILLAPMIHTHTISYGADTWFHMMRIYEMRNSLKDGSIFGTIGNVFTFGSAGQAINGMYPSATLRILVLTTNWLSPVNQVYGIMILILWITSVCNLYVFYKLGVPKFQALLAAITMTYILSFYLIIKSGSLGLAISIGLVPLVFYGLFLIQSNDYKERKKAALIIGIGIGLIFLTHVMSAMFGVIIVIMSAIWDLIYKKHNFLNYVFSGFMSMIIGLPTIVTILMMGKETLPVASFEKKARSILNFFSPLWDAHSGTAYLGWTSLTVLAVIYVITSLLISEKHLKFKIIALLNIVMGTNLGYSSIMNFIQFPERFWIFGTLLCVFVLIIECFNGNEKGMIRSIIISILVLISATNIAYNYYQKLGKQVLWQNTSRVYDRNNTKIDSDSYKYGEFKKLRTYIDYLPIQQKRTALLPPKASTPSKEMLDVNFSKNTRPTGFNKSSIKVNKKGNIVAYNKMIITKVKRNSVCMRVKISKNTKYDLPFWAYDSNKYVVYDNGKTLDYKISSEGRLSVSLVEGGNKIKIKQRLPKVILVSYLISIIAFLISLSLLKLV